MTVNVSEMSTTAPHAHGTEAVPEGQAPPDEVDQVVGEAAEALSAWRRTPPAERAAALRVAAGKVRESMQELGELLCATTGRLLSEAVGSAAVVADQLEEAAVLGLVDRGTTLPGSPAHHDWTRSEPRGVVAVLTPWNDPFPAAGGLIAAALVAGNTVVHKPSERSAAPGLALGRLIAAELPPGVLGLVQGGPSVGEQLTRDERIRVVTHIGSSATGRQIRRICGERGAKALLENGGKDALLVDAGVDPRWAARQAAVGAFTNAGQLCTSVERIYVHRSVADDFITALVAEADAISGGDPRLGSTQMCRLVDGAQLEVVQGHVELALAEGARLAAGGRVAGGDPLWFAPTVLVGCRADMAVMREETFGPVAPVMVVDSWDVGLAQAASGSYGLAATVLTPDTGHAMEAVDTLDVGTVKINAVFGGAPGGSADPRSGSGQGCGYGPELLHELTVLKAVHWEPPGSADGSAPGQSSGDG
jgi:succinate-semialdehyde dehydrogenase/glutarate-semialdehyde dehydrogenase